MGFRALIPLLLLLCQPARAEVGCVPPAYRGIEEAFRAAGFLALEERAAGELPLFEADQVFFTKDFAQRAYLRFVPVKGGTARARIRVGSKGEFLVAPAGPGTEAVILFDGAPLTAVERIADGILEKGAETARRDSNWFIGTAEAAVTEAVCAATSSQPGMPDLGQLEKNLELILRSQGIAGADAELLRGYWTCLKGALSGIGKSVAGTIHAPVDTVKLFATLARIRFEEIDHKPVTTPHGIIEAIEWPFTFLSGALRFPYLRQNSEAFSAILSLGRELFSRFASQPADRQLKQVCTALSWIGTELLQLFLVGKMPLSELTKAGRFRGAIEAVKGATDEKIVARIKSLGLSAQGALGVRKALQGDPVLVDRLLQLMQEASRAGREQVIGQIGKLSEAEAELLRARLRSYVARCAL